MTFREYQDQLDTSYRHLRAGHKYVVAIEFKDYDYIMHHVGETWTFIGSNFVPYEDGLSLFAVVGGADQQVRLQDRPDEQREIIADLEKYLVRDE